MSTEIKFFNNFVSENLIKSYNFNQNDVQKIKKEALEAIEYNLPNLSSDERKTAWNIFINILIKYATKSVINIYDKSLTKSQD